VWFPNCAWWTGTSVEAGGANGEEMVEIIKILQVLVRMALHDQTVGN
jgi:hypothetical protein